VNCLFLFGFTDCREGQVASTRFCSCHRFELQNARIFAAVVKSVSGQKSESWPDSTVLREGSHGRTMGSPRAASGTDWIVIAGISISDTVGSSGAS
jgi:hypothetical protein